MSNEIKKVSKIIDKLVTYFLHNGAKNIAFNLTESIERYELKFVIEDFPEFAKDLEEFESKISARKQPELENYYWQLAGEIENSNELNIVAMMCDDISFSYENSKLELSLKRLIKPLK